jgi:hypothetical protein
MTCGTHSAGRKMYSLHAYVFNPNDPPKPAIIHTFAADSRPHWTAKHLQQVRELTDQVMRASLQRKV